MWPGGNVVTTTSGKPVLHTDLRAADAHIALEPESFRVTVLQTGFPNWLLNGTQKRMEVLSLRTCLMGAAVGPIGGYAITVTNGERQSIVEQAGERAAPSVIPRPLCRKSDYFVNSKKFSET